MDKYIKESDIIKKLWELESIHTSEYNKIIRKMRDYKTKEAKQKAEKKLLILQGARQALFEFQQIICPDPEY